jgi:IclR family pca regulon transcriptional regulator
MTDEPTIDEQDGDFVQSLDRGLSVIRAFDADHASLSLSEVAAATGLSRAAARRFLHTLVHLGYMHNNDGRFTLRPKILELGYAYLSSLTLPEVAMPHMEELVEEVRESSSVSELDGEDVVYIARVPTKRIMTMTISVGTRFPAYATSMGRVLLAAQPEDWLERYLAAVSLHGLTGRTITSPAGCDRSCARSAAAAGRWWTRSWKRGCARSPRRSGTATAGWSPPSTCPRTRAGAAWKASCATCSTRCSPRRSASGGT